MDEPEIVTEAKEADRRLQEEELRVRQTPPGERDLSDLLRFMGTEDLREATVEYYTVEWGDAYDGDGARLSVVGQKAEVLPDGSVRLRICELNRTDTNVLGVSVPMRVEGRRGVIRVWARVEGESALLLVDNQSDPNICREV
ncbi:MAG TPA: hypothetical protein DCR14_05060 [Acidimicrobiaceae bacterium]|nr:hypothetical protein [Acidimicrobiaceae bacterium]